MESISAAYFESQKSDVQKSWEIGRLIAWANFQSQSKKRLNLKSFMPFDWEKPSNEIREKAMSKEAMKKIIQRFEMKKKFKAHE